MRLWSSSKPAAPAADEELDPASMEAGPAETEVSAAADAVGGIAISSDQEPNQEGVVCKLYPDLDAQGRFSLPCTQPLPANLSAPPSFDILDVLGPDTLSVV